MSASHRRPFVIYASSFNETSGGQIALYLLCAQLIERGEKAAIWAWGRPRRIPRWRRCTRAIRKFLGIPRPVIPLETGPFQVPIAQESDLQDAIVIYPEVTVGNPLQSQRVVRWFLHRPGYHSGRIEFGPNELYFFYQDAFNDPAINPDPTNRLTLTWLNPAYSPPPASEREGTCYLIRKGKDRIDRAELGDALIVDDLSHTEKAAAFQRYKYLVSYDLYSMYAVYAAICGCIPIVKPIEGVTEAAWFPKPEDRYGIAYGWENEAWAIETRPLLEQRLAQTAVEQEALLTAFLTKVHARFGPIHSPVTPDRQPG